tara:strand:+ start:1229 stop:1972 length:744 start_codon:yes stop_codon:yes gene_type:complete
MEFKIPTEVIELPSKGLLYPKENPLSSGTVEMKYMTAKEEDILTNRNYMRNGTVIDKLLQSLLVTENVNYGDILVGDKNAIMVAARILSYGKDYKVEYNDEIVTVDLSKVENKDIDYSLLEKGENEFSLDLPSTGNSITFKLLTQGDEMSIEKEIEGKKKIKKDASPEVTTRLKYIITSINGSREKKDIRNFVDNFLLASDARAIRQEYEKVQPDLDLSFKYLNDNGVEEDASIPITLGFFWPDSRG